ENIAQDLRAVESVDGVQMISPLERKDLKDPDLVRHGDSAMAGCLAWHASLNMTYDPVVHSRGRRRMPGILRGY
ncbi:hypothetical protein G6582_004919, partial [Salmonella enterica]|nr:hypothetical protein [Salmonella enterica]